MNTNKINNALSSIWIALLLCFFNMEHKASAQLNKTADATVSDLIRTGDEAIRSCGEIAEVVAPKGSFSFGLAALIDVQNELKKLLDSVPVGNADRASIWYERLSKITDAVGIAKTSRLQADLFKIIPGVAEFESEPFSELPDFAQSATDLMQNTSKVVVKTIARRIVEANASISPDEARLFVLAFSCNGFIPESDWEDEVIPVDSAGVFILDSGNVFQYLKSQSWQRAEQFMGGLDGREAFVRYEGGGNGLEVIKSKFALNRANIVAKWDELGAWVAMQRGANE